MIPDWAMKAARRINDEWSQAQDRHWSPPAVERVAIIMASLAQAQDDDRRRAEIEQAYFDELTRRT